MADLKGISLTLLMGPAAVAPAPAAVVQAFESAQITRGVDQRSGFQISFSYSKTSPIATQMLPAGFFDPMIRVILVATLNGVPHVLADGPIKRQDVSASAHPGENKLTITGEDVTSYMDLIAFDGMPYPAMPPFARVALILAKYAMFGVIPVTIPTPFSFTASPTEKYAHQKGTDYAYAKKLAEDAGYAFYATPGPLPGTNTVYWGPEIRVGVPQPAITIDMDQASNIDGLNFSADGNAAELTYAYVKIAGFSVPLPMPPVSLLKPPLSARPLLTTKLRLLDTERKSAPEVLEALLAGGARAEPMSAQGSLDLQRYGTPLDARQLVGVRGAGLAHDGLWFVKQVTHTLGRGSWKQSFQLGRDGLIANVPAVRP
jgi:hypothetical protein